VRPRRVLDDREEPIAPIFRVSSFSVRIVPTNFADCGIMFRAVPAFIIATVTTIDSSGGQFREAMVCSAVMHAAAPTIGSREKCG